MERKTPLELLEPSRFDDVNIISKNWGVLSGTTLGFLGSTLANVMARRPFYSGVHKIVIITAGFAYAGVWLQKFRDEKLSMRDAIMRDYISQHPELFEQPPRQKFGEVLLKWYPVR